MTYFSPKISLLKNQCNFRENDTIFFAKYSPVLFIDDDI